MPTSKENPHAVYVFNEKGFEGVRLYLKKVREEREGPLLEEIQRRADEVVCPGTGGLIQYVVYFRVIKDLPLVLTRGQSPLTEVFSHST
jgi:hypothetical protein